MKKVMLIAGGEWQKSIAKKIKDCGYYLIVSNLYKDSPAFVYADECYVANVLDKEKNLEIAKKCKPDAIITDQSDIAVPTVAYLCENLGLRGIGMEVARLFTNKYCMRDFCSKNGFSCIKYRLCENLDEAIEFYNTYGRSIIKPIDSQSSRGVHIINSEQDVLNYFTESVSFSNSEKKILIEEYIDGKEFTVDGVKTPDDYAVLAISEKEHYKENPNIAKKLFFSYDNDKFDYDKLRKLNHDMVMKMGMPYGITHAEYKFANGEFYLIEIAARGGGTRISSDIVPIMSGVDHNRLLVEMSLGKDVSLPKVEATKRCAVLNFLEFPEGRVKKIIGLDEAKKIDGIVDIVLDFKENDYISAPKDDRTRVGFYIAYAKDRENMMLLSNEVEKLLEVEYYDN